MNPLSRVVVISQLGILAAWEALGLLAFDWNGWIVAAVWFVGLWTFNVLTLSAADTYFKLIQPPAPDNVVPLKPVPDITPEDLGG